MFKKLLFRALKSLTPDEKILVSKYLKVEDEKEQNIEEDEKQEEIKEKEEDGGEPNMPNDEKKDMVEEKDIKETENNEVDNSEATETKNVEINEENKEEVVDETQNQQPQVQEVEEQGNGIRINDLVTKDELADRLSAIEAKFDAVVKENEDLKNKLVAMQDKYENKDFGNNSGNNISTKSKDVYSSFSEYSKQFM